MRNSKGQLVTRKFAYSKTENPRIIYYCYGAIVIVRPITVVDKYGDLKESYEIANKDISKDSYLTNRLTNNEECELQDILNNYISNSDFEKLEINISNKFLNIL